MKKILIIGSCGAGKTVFSKKLGTKTALPVVHLDELFWLPGWVRRDENDFDELLEAELSKESWIIDGNYDRTLIRRMAFADAVIYLDYNRFICLWRALKRTLVHKPYHAKGCAPRLDLAFLGRIVWWYPHVFKNHVYKCRQLHPELKWVTLKNSRQAERYLQTL